MLGARTQRLLELTAKGKREGPLTYDEAEGLDAARDWLRLHRASVELEDQLGELRELVVTAIQPWHEQKCADGFTPTVLVAVAKGTVQIVLGPRFRKIAAERAAVIKKELGKDFEKCFQPMVTLKLRKSVAEDPPAMEKALRDLAKALGQERFAELFETELTYQPSEQFGELLAWDRGLRDGLGIEQVVQVSEKKDAVRKAA